MTRFYPFRKFDPLELTKLKGSGFEDPCKTMLLRWSDHWYNWFQTNTPSYQLTADLDSELSQTMVWLWFADENDEVIFKLNFPEEISLINVRHG